ncbi:MAG: ATP-binding protein [bacterium]|nr:ATP-binding protein [bacterium]
MASENALSHAGDAWPDEAEVVDSTVIPPDPKIMEAIGLNYALEAAVADLVDNSIDAGAENVLIRFIQRGPRLASLCVVDNGCGMDKEQLNQAMALGKRRNYRAGDLGHFGLGLKAASLGQAKSLTVISRTSASSASGRRWQIENMTDRFECDVMGKNYAERLLNRPWGSFPLQTGTLVLWDDVESFPVSSDASTTNSYVEQTVRLLRDHLGLVFHRLIDEGTVTIEIDVEDISIDEIGPPWLVEPIDPFGYGKSGKSEYPRILKVKFDSRVLDLECHIWPPRSRAKGFRIPGTANHKGQGFYFYRNHRLLQIGGWNGLYQPHSQHQLARVAIEMDDSVYDHLKMNPEKTQIRASESLIRAIETAEHKGFDLNGYREEAAQRLRESRQQPGARQRVIPPGRGFAPAVRQAIQAELESIPGQQPLNIRWRHLEDHIFFEIDRDQQTIHLNTKYRHITVDDRRSHINDAPLLKAALYLLMHELFQGEYLGPKEKDAVNLWNAILTAAALVDSQ